MLEFLISLAHAAELSLPLPEVEARVVDHGETQHAMVKGSLGLELEGTRPGVAARLDLGHRVGVDGRLYAGVPLAEGVKWNGGASVGLSLSPVSWNFGQRGSVDLRVGAGGRVETVTGGRIAVGNLDWSVWTRGTIEISPDGSWTFFGGVVMDATEAPEVVPTVGFRIR